MSILSQALIPHFLKSKLAFHHAKDVLHSSTGSRVFTVKLALRFRQFLVAAVPPSGQIQRIGCCFKAGAAFSSKGRVTAEELLFTMQQIIGDNSLMDIGAGGSHRVNQSCFAIDTGMSINAEVSLIAFLGLVHIRIAPLPLLLLRGAGRADNAAINDKLTVQFQVILLQIFIHQVEELGTQSTFQS